MALGTHNGMSKMIVFSLVGGFLLFGMSMYADGSERILPFQAYLADGGGRPVEDGKYSLIFRLYDMPVGGDAGWIESHVDVLVAKGIVNVQ